MTSDGLFRTPMIYLIDDDPSVREALHLLLQTYELPVTCFESLPTA